MKLKKKKKNQRKGCGYGLLYYSKIFRVKYGNYPQVWSNAKHIQDISKLANLVPKQKHCVIKLYNTIYYSSLLFPLLSLLDLRSTTTTNQQSVTTTTKNTIQNKPIPNPQPLAAMTTTAFITTQNKPIRNIAKSSHIPTTIPLPNPRSQSAFGLSEREIVNGMMKNVWTWTL